MEIREFVSDFTLYSGFLSLLQIFTPAKDFDTHIDKMIAKVHGFAAYIHKYQRYSEQLIQQMDLAFDLLESAKGKYDGGTHTPQDLNYEAAFFALLYSLRMYEHKNRYLIQLFEDYPDHSEGIRELWNFLSLYVFIVMRKRELHNLQDLRLRA